MNERTKRETESESAAAFAERRMPRTDRRMLTQLQPMPMRNETKRKVVSKNHNSLFLLREE